MQITMISGPAPAGAMIKKFGTMWAFFIDAISFLFIIAPLSVIPDPEKTPGQHSARNVWHSILEGLRYVFNDSGMRTMIAFSTSLNFFIMGPIMVGLAIIAKRQFNSATAYGIMFSAFAFGGLAGILMRGRRKQLHRGILILVVGGVIGILLSLVGLVHSLIALCGLLFLMGVTSVYSAVHITSWYQQRIESSMMGRVMSLRMFGI